MSARPKKPRDFQRSRVYDAGSTARMDSHWFASLEEMQAFVDDVTASDGWEGPHPIEVRLTRRDSRTSECHDSGKGGIRISPGHGSNQLTVLHELAHALDAPGPDHGPEFCRAWLDLVARYGYPGDLARLQNAFREQRVQVAPPSAALHSS
jgi:hypothetical protein